VVRRKPVRGLDSVRMMSDLRKLTAAIMSDRPEAAGYMAHIALGEPVATPADSKCRATRIVRMNPMMQPLHAGTDEQGHDRWNPYGWFAEPSSVSGRTLFERLVALDMDAVADGEVRDIERLAELWLEGRVPNQPIYSDDRLAPVIGQAVFADALAAWRAMDTDRPAPIEPVRDSWLAALWRRLRDRIARRPPRAAAGPLIAPSPMPKATAASPEYAAGRAEVD
jgi:hypothetical protein